MGWIDDWKKRNKDKQVPKELEGKSDDDVLAMLAAANKDKEDKAALETKVKEQDAAVLNIQTEFEKVKTRLAASEANRQPPPRGEDKDPADFVTEPDRAFAERIGPLANVALQTAATTARMLAQQQLTNADAASNNKQMDGRLFSMWAGEIDQEARKYQSIQLGNVQAWLGIFYYLKGVHADELRDPETRKKKYNFLESAASTSAAQGVDDGKPKPSADQLTDQEKHIADKMHVSYDSYLKRKKDMQFVSA
jgi:hypothetical protein